MMFQQCPGQLLAGIAQRRRLSELSRWSTREQDQPNALPHRFQQLNPHSRRCLVLLQDLDLLGVLVDRPSRVMRHDKFDGHLHPVASHQVLNVMGRVE